MNEAYVGYGSRKIAVNFSELGFEPIHVREVIE